jgi:hypothetical protein
MPERRRSPQPTSLKARVAAAPPEVICPACDGTGFQKIKQSTEPGRKVYPAKCAVCLGKGRIEKPAASRYNHQIGSIRNGYLSPIKELYLGAGRD